MEKIFSTYEWVDGAWEVTGWSNDVSEGDVWIGELSSQEAIHGGVVAGDLEVSPEHLEGFVLASIHNWEGLLGSENNIDNNVGIGVGLLALVDN